jgi:hypothetical protein
MAAISSPAIPQPNGYTFRSMAFEYFCAQDAAVKTALVFGAAIVGYSLLTSTFAAALAGSYIGARIATHPISMPFNNPFVTGKQNTVNPS